MSNNIVNRKTETIDLRIILKKIYKNKKIFYKTLSITFILSCAIILCVPRYYTSTLSLAPETGGAGIENSLGSLASSFGFDISSMQTNDAISPMLYPDLMEDNGFIVRLFNIQVRSQDGEINTTYYNYRKKYQKRAWWTAAMGFVGKLFAEKDTTRNKSVNDINPYDLSKKQDDIANAIRGDINISIDKKTAVITIMTKAQDPLICKILADSVQEHLQHFITEYRTNKARIDLEYYKKLSIEAKQEYEKARQLYGTYADANTNITLVSFKAKMNDLENDMQLKYNTYSTMMTQYQAAKAKVQEKTPAFTTIKGASVPIKPSGPKRMLFVIGMMILASFGTVIFLLKDEIKNFLLPEDK